MKKESNTAEILGNNGEFDDAELLEGGGQDRTLMLKAAPRPRKLHLIAQGAKEIRCICCHRIRPLIGAEDSDEGWICEDCVVGMMQGQNASERESDAAQIPSFSQESAVLQT
ncbi:MAG: hypothetical protein A4E65_02868 [Syntrophorhabdus sp. PtaU1.Bin153]|nr:MAG: hypothetical protein A4E65_02868 [Syntrophorhabdus sp. PtaU1.Bin153]